jgi:nitrate reductase gamma subunit
MIVLQIATYVLFAIFVVAFTAKIFKYAKMPIHLRWELYPLAGETKRPWGGSYLEELDWEKKPPEKKSFIGEMTFMGKEIIFFKEYFHRNRGLWYIVFPFHVGIFMYVTFFALLFIGALTLIGGISVAAESSNAWGLLIFYVTLVVGVAALIFGAIACLALFVRKIVDPGMSTYTRRIEYFNIFFVLAMFVTGLVAWGIADPGFETARAYMKSLITFSSVGSMDAIIVVHIILLALLLAYLPFTNIMHFFAKHFTFTKVRWDDAPNLRGSALERKLAPLLAMRITWAAPHMQTLNKWSDIASEGIGESPTKHTTQKGGS